MNNRSLAFQLGIYVILTITIVIAVIVYINFNFNTKIVIDKIEESAKLQSGYVTNQVENILINVKEVTRNVSNQVVYYNNHGDLEHFLSQALKENNAISAFHIELIEDTGTRYLTVSASDSLDEIELEESDRYQISILNDIRGNVLDSNEGIWSEPFCFGNDTSSLTISYLKKIEDNNDEIRGILSGYVNLDFLDQLVDNDKFRPGWSVLIIKSDGTLLTKTEESWNFKKNSTNISSQLISENEISLNDLSKKQESFSGFFYPNIKGGERTWIQFSPIPDTNWFVVVMIPSSELFHDLDSMLRENVIVSSVGILLILLIIILIFRRTLMPLSSIVKSIQHLSFGEKGKSKKKNEIELLSESFFELQKQYSSYQKEQNQNRKDRRKYEKDLKSAKEIQTAIIPNENPPFRGHPEIELYATLTPAESIGGDLYDYFFIDSNHVLFTIGDVSGKGIPAALFMAVAHTLIKSKSTVLSARHIVEQVNKELCSQNYNQYFLTLFLGILDVETGILDYCNAAHNYPILIKTENELRYLENTHGLPLGVFSNKSYTGDTIVLKKGDTLVLFTDGVTECKDLNDNNYGQERLIENVGNMIDVPVSEMVTRIHDSLKVYRGEAPQHDDISLMAVRYWGKK